MKKEQKLYQVTPFGSIKEMLEIAKDSSGDNTAFRYKEAAEERMKSYGEFYNDVCALGEALCELSVLPCHIACLSENRYEWINVFLTMLLSPGVFVAIDRDRMAQELISLLSESDSEAIFCSQKYENLFKENTDKLSGVKYFICFDRDTDDGNFLSFKGLLEHGRELISSGGKEFLHGKRLPSEAAMLVYTSGTTGAPKGVLLSEANLVHCVRQGLSLVRYQGRYLSVLPLSHVYESVCGILGTIHSHGEICINDSPKNLLSNMARWQPEYMLLVPSYIEAFYKMIMKKHRRGSMFRKLLPAGKLLRRGAIGLNKAMFASVYQIFGGKLKKIICGGAPLSPEVAEFFGAIGIKVLIGYGVTECSPLVSVNREDNYDYHSVGIPLPSVKIKIEDPDEDGNGSILVKGPTVMSGYYKNPSLTAEVLRPKGWFVTGDLGYINEENRLVLTGRMTNLIVLNNARKVHPEEIEGYIQRIPYVKEVVVYGIRDGVVLRGLCAEVYMDPEQVTDFNEGANALQNDIPKALSRLPAYKQISSIVVRPQEFPKTSTNKIKRTGLGVQ